MRGRDFIINALIASPPGHPLWLELMSRMVSDYRPLRCLEFHATYVIRMAIAKLDAAVEAYPLDHDDITVLSHEAFYASPPAERLLENRRRLAAASDSYAIHHYEDSWFSPLGKTFNLCLHALQRLKQKLTFHTAPERSPG